MRKLKTGDNVLIVKPVIIKKRFGGLERYLGRVVVVTEPQYDGCMCDLGLDKPVRLPYSHLEKVA